MTMMTTEISYLNQVERVAQNPDKFGEGRNLPKASLLQEENTAVETQPYILYKHIFLREAESEN
jgi:hypothetical protein